MSKKRDATNGHKQATGGREPNGNFAKGNSIGLATRFGQPNGNNAYPSPAKHYLYHYMARYLECTPDEIKDLNKNKKKLTCSQIIALKTIDQAIKNDRLDEVKLMIERELGKAKQEISQDVKQEIVINVTSYGDDKE